MKRSGIFSHLLPALAFGCAMGAAAPALAQSAVAPAGAMVPVAAPVVSKTVAGRLSMADKFKTEAAAQASCPADTVVWSTMARSKVMHLSGSRYFGRTKRGAYICEKTALAAGYRLAKD